MIHSTPCVCVQSISEDVSTQTGESRLIARRERVCELTHTVAGAIAVTDLSCLCLTLLAQATTQQHLCITCDSQSRGGVCV